MFRLTEVKTNTADWWLKGQAPAPETVDNPYPSSKVVKCVKIHSFRVCSRIFPTRFECVLHLLFSFRVWFSANYYIEKPPAYTPYIGSLWNQLDLLLEKNEVSFPLVSSVFLHLFHPSGV